MTDLKDLLAPEDHQAPQVLTESRESRDLLDNPSIHLTVHLVHQVIFVEICLTTRFLNPQHDERLKQNSYNHHHHVLFQDPEVKLVFLDPLEATSN